MKKIPRKKISSDFFCQNKKNTQIKNKKQNNVIKYLIDKKKANVIAIYIYIYFKNSWNLFMVIN